MPFQEAHADLHAYTLTPDSSYMNHRPLRSHFPTHFPGVAGVCVCFFLICFNTRTEANHAESVISGRGTLLKNLIELLDQILPMKIWWHVKFIRTTVITNLLCLRSHMCELRSPCLTKCVRVEIFI